MFQTNPKVRLDKIEEDFFNEHNVSLSLLREDLLHPEISGNKWRKLKYNIEHALEKEYDAVLTFGGAFSNHIAATAAAGREFGIKTIGVIRGDELDENNPTLSLAHENGMEFKFISREQYRDKNSIEFLEELRSKFGNVFIVPEGGANTYGVLGCKEIVSENLDFDVVTCACGTGSTLAGIVASLRQNQFAIGFPALKKAEFLIDDVKNFLDEVINENSNWRLELEYHFGGYAKQNEELVKFIQAFYRSQKIKLDPVYTGKMMFGLYDLIKKGELDNKKIIAVHTGGMQGAKPFMERYNVDLYPLKS